MYKNGIHPQFDLDYILNKNVFKVLKGYNSMVSIDKNES